MRFLCGLILAVWCACAMAQARPSIRVHVADWGGASAQDIQAVLHSVAQVLLPDFPNHASVRIVVGFNPAGPRVLAEKSVDGAHQVLLNVRGARWDQFAYQFAHELCHIVSNYDQREIATPQGRAHQWFEETLCEVVSVVALDRLASHWKQSPPYPGWAEYAPAFRRYADRLLNDEHRRSAGAMSLAAWYRENAVPLDRDPYLREKNELAATALVRLFAEAPGGLQAIGYLNLARPSHDGLAAYLAAWYECCPEEHRALVTRLISLFDIT